MDSRTITDATHDSAGDAGQNSVSEPARPQSGRDPVAGGAGGHPLRIKPDRRVIVAVMPLGAERRLRRSSPHTS
jgi:hypothetical protein